MELTRWFHLLLKKRPKKKDEDRRSTEYRLAEFSPTSIAPPAPASFQVRRATIPNPPDTNYKTHENYSDEHPERARVFASRGSAGGAGVRNRSSTSDDALHAIDQSRREHRRNVVRSHGQSPVKWTSPSLESDSYIEDPTGDPTFEDTSWPFELSTPTNATPVTAGVRGLRGEGGEIKAVTPPLIRSKLTLGLCLTTASLPSDPRVLKLRTLGHKLQLLFPEDASHVSSVLSNGQVDQEGIVGPRGSKLRSEGALIHVFIDHSNILIGFLSYLKRHPEIVAGRTTKHLSHAALVFILERGRSVTRRILVASSPLYQPMKSAEQLGYEVQVLVRVPDMGDGMDRKGKRNPTGSGITRTAPGRNHARHKSAGDAVTWGNSDGVNVSLPPTSARTEFGGAIRMGSPAGTPGGSTRVKYREQGVDELLQLKLYQTIVNVRPVPPDATIVLATGDGNVGEFNEEGFLGCVRSALRDGWRVELYAWEEGLSRSWRREFSKGPYRHRFSIHDLSEFGEDLLEV